MIEVFQTSIAFGREALVFGAGKMGVDSFLEEFHFSMSLRDVELVENLDRFN